MPYRTTSASRRHRASESDARAPFSSPYASNDDPFNEDSTPFATYGAGAGSVAGPSASPSPPAARSPESNGLAGQPPSTIASFTKRLTSWRPPRESASPVATALPVESTRSKSEGAGTAGGSGVPALHLNGRALTPRGTSSSTAAKAPSDCARSPRVGASGAAPSTPTTTPRNPPASRPSGLSSAPTVPLRRRVTPPPVILTVPRGSALATAVAAPASPSFPSPRQRTAEAHEPFLDAHRPPNASSTASRASGEAAAATATTPLSGKPPVIAGTNARATARLSTSTSSSLRTGERDAPSRSQSSSAPCWVTDTSNSTPESFEEEERQSKNARPPFFSAAPACGDYTPLIDWLMRRGEYRDVGLPSTCVSISSATSTTSRTPQAAFFNEDFITKLCAAATAVLIKEPGLLHLHVPAEDTLVVVGDIHGQFQDLYTSVLCQQYDRRRCNPGGLDRHFLFMGDYVDRGPHSLEVVLLLLALKVEYPTLVYLTRGNHEEEKTSRVYGFLTEATSSLGAAAGAAVWSAVNKVFLDLPLAAIVTTPRMRFFVTHGGLSPALHSVNEIAAVNRNRYSAGDITADQDDMVTGLLWSDPTNDVPMYRRNPRGCGFMFGPTASYNFCVENNVDFICRAHQVAMEGFIWTHNERVVTVFSAPNYCGVNGNKGAVMVVNGHTLRPILKQYESIETAEEAPGPRPVFPYSTLFS